MAKQIIEILLPVIGIGLMIYYEICDTACAALKGTFLGIDLKPVGMVFMGVLFLIALPLAVPRWPQMVKSLRTMMLSFALGGEIILVHFQVAHAVFCPYCLAFASLILILFLIRVREMHLHLVAICFASGVLAFLLFFRGSIIPQYALVF
jgi:hypothetical protein